MANVHSYIEKRIDPADKPDAFNFYNARVLYQDIAEIEEAQLKARKAQDTLDLSSHTNNENIENKNYTSTQQKHYLNSKNSKLPNPPLFNMSYNEFDGDDSDMDKTYNPRPKKNYLKS